MHADALVRAPEDKLAEHQTAAVNYDFIVKIWQQEW